MRTLRHTIPALAAALAASASTLAQNNVSEDNKFAWGENIGWTNWRDGGGAGVVFTDLNLLIVPEGDPYAFLSGFIWAENAGWINIGDGDGPYEAADGFGQGSDLHFGVNVLTNGALEGFAWGENLGWINFGTTPFISADGARFDSSSNRLRGYAWSENAGWINLDNMDFFIGVNLCPADLDGSGAVGSADLANLLADWGPCPAEGPCPADFDDSGAVNSADLADLLAVWGPCD